MTETAEVPSRDPVPVRRPALGWLVKGLALSDLAAAACVSIATVSMEPHRTAHAYTQVAAHVVIAALLLLAGDALASATRVGLASGFVCCYFVYCGLVLSVIFAADPKVKWSELPVGPVVLWIVLLVLSAAWCAPVFLSHVSRSSSRSAR